LIGDTEHVLRLVTVLVLGAPYLLLAVLTTIGSCRRGVAVGPSVLCGLVFPVTWVVWYIRDGGLKPRARA
jgi:hypothetical protein